MTQEVKKDRSALIYEKLKHLHDAAADAAKRHPATAAAIAGGALGGVIGNIAGEDKIVDTLTGAGLGAGLGAIGAKALASKTPGGVVEQLDEGGSDPYIMRHPVATGAMAAGGALAGGAAIAYPVRKAIKKNLPGTLEYMKNEKLSVPKAILGLITGNPGLYDALGQDFKGAAKVVAKAKP